MRFCLGGISCSIDPHKPFSESWVVKNPHVVFRTNNDACAEHDLLQVWEWVVVGNFLSCLLDCSRYRWE